jgi:hypothetical protein
MAAEFNYLVRVVDERGETIYGNLRQEKEDLVGSQVEHLTGDPITGLKKTGETRTVAKVYLLLPMNLAINSDNGTVSRCFAHYRRPQFSNVLELITASTPRRPM